MENKRTVIDITEILSSKQEKFIVQNNNKKQPFFHSNPIYKKLLAFANDKLKEKFSLKDLFR